MMTDRDRIAAEIFVRRCSSGPVVLVTEGALVQGAAECLAAADCFMKAIGDRWKADEKKEEKQP